jgi:hypothetical protein
MAEERLDLRKEVFNKAQYIKTIDTSFDQLGVTSLTEDLEAQVTVEEFFGLYNSLFYDIPALGETNSHEYLVRTSGEYVNFDEINEEVRALQAEIAQLRQDLLNAQMENAQAAAAGSQDPATDALLKQTNMLLNNANAQLVETNTSIANNTETSTNEKSSTSSLTSGTTQGFVSRGY